MLKYPPEDEYGNIEYKSKLVDKNEDRIIGIASQMRFRTTEGNGESIYVIGVSDDGEVIGVDDDEFTESFNNLSLAASKNSYTMTMLSSKDLPSKKKVYELLIREKNEQKYIDIKVAIAGNVDAGKCLQKNTKIRLYSGEVKNVEDIIAGDILMGDDSTPRRVLETTRGFGQLYSIIPENGEPLNVNKNHILCFKCTYRSSVSWDETMNGYVVKYVLYENSIPKLLTALFQCQKIIGGGNQSYENQSDMEAYNASNKFLNSLELVFGDQYVQYGDIVEMNLGQYLDMSDELQENLKLYRTSVEYPESIVDVDPYMVGYFIGNLSFMESNREKDVDDFSCFLKKYNILDNKRIPNTYKYNTRSIRMKLLAGLIHSNRNNGRYTILIKLKYKKLYNDIIEVVRSLGFETHSSYETRVSENEPEYTQIRIDGRGVEDIPVATLKYRLYPSKKFDIGYIVGIKDIKLLPDQEYYGFEIDGNNRYLHSDFTVAHNSSLLGVLTSGKNDDGRGRARLSIFNFKHEVSTGRTSSIAHHILGFNDKGNVMNYSGMHKKGWPEIVKDSSKVISFFDLCGHEKYLRTTILGLTSSFPDLCMILVGANMGITRMTQEHIFLCVTLKIPFAIVITKIDICKNRKNILKDTVKSINKLLKLPGLRRIPYKVSNIDDVIICAKNVQTESIVPIFHVSNVTGVGINFIKQFLNLLGKVRTNIKDNVKESIMHIDTTFTVPGVGTVVGGQLVSGKIKVGDKMMIGPNNGEYTETQIRSIHCKRVPMQEVNYGSYVCLGLKKIDRKSIRRGNVIISKGSPEIARREFEAEISVLKSHSTTIKPGYEPVIHTCTMRQSAKLVSIKNKVNARHIEDTDDNEYVLRTGDKATVKFRFSYRPEYIKSGDRMLMAEGRVKIVGVVK